MMKSKTAVSKQESGSIDAISRYAKAQLAEHAEVIRVLRSEIDASLPAATSKIWHAIPVWFVGGNPVVGYNITAKKLVNLLFWNGQAFDEPALKAAGQFKAAQIQFKDVSEIDPKILRLWLKKAGTMIWDYQGMCKGKKIK